MNYDRKCDFYVKIHKKALFRHRFLAKNKYKKTFLPRSSRRNHHYHRHHHHHHCYHHRRHHHHGSRRGCDHLHHRRHHRRRHHHLHYHHCSYRSHYHSRRRRHRIQHRHQYRRFHRCRSRFVTAIVRKAWRYINATAVVVVDRVGGM